MNKEKISRLLKEKGMKATAARIGLLSALAKERLPISIKDIGKKVKAPDQSTLYRSLKALVAEGLVREILLDKSTARYEISAGRSHHHHVVCTGCGFIEDIMGCPQVKSSGFASITGHSLEFFGICQACDKR